VCGAGSQIEGSDSYWLCQKYMILTQLVSHPSQFTVLPNAMSFSLA
jgi:hypothetical protein